MRFSPVFLVHLLLSLFNLLGNKKPLVFDRMIIAAVGPIAAFAGGALSGLVELWMVFKLFPPVALIAVFILDAAALSVAGYVRTDIPLFTNFGFVRLSQWVSPEILVRLIKNITWTLWAYSQLDLSC